MTFQPRPHHWVSFSCLFAISGGAGVLFFISDKHATLYGYPNTPSLALILEYLVALSFTLLTAHFFRHRQQISRGAAYGALAGTALTCLLVGLSITGFSPKLIGQRRQKQTMLDIRSLAMALESYARAHGHYPSAQALLVPRNPQHDDSRPHQWPPSAWPPALGTKTTDLLPFLVPAYSRHLSTKDAWGFPFHCAIRDDLKSYTILSFGSDGVEDARHPLQSPEGVTSWDLGFVDGSFVLFPEGRAR